jgi:flagellar protein FlbD
MITLTGLDSKEFILNEDQVEKIEEVPESIITLTNGKKYIVKESNEEIIKLIIKYKRKIFLSNIEE